MLMNLPFVSLSMSDIFGVNVAIVISLFLRINLTRIHIIVNLSYQ